MLTDSFMVDHFGIAVPDIDEARVFYECLGFSASSDIIQVEEQSVKALMMKNGLTKIELLSPLHPGEPSPVNEYIKTKPYKIYHIAFLVSDLDEEIRQLKSKRYIVISEPKPSEIQKQKRTVFLFHRKIGIIELVEE